MTCSTVHLVVVHPFIVMESAEVDDVEDAVNLDDNGWF